MRRYAVTGLTVALHVIGAQAQSIRYGTAHFGGSRYVIAQQELHTLNALDQNIYLATEDGYLSVVWQNYANAAYVRHFNEWGNPLNEPIRIDESGSDRNDSPICGSLGGGITWAFWTDVSGAVGSAVRTNGTVAVDRFDVTDAPEAGECVAVSSSRAVFADAGGVGGSNVDLFLYLFSSAGIQLGPRIVFSETSRREQTPGLALLSDDTLIAGYIRSDLTPESRPRMVARRIEVDMTVHPFVELSPQRVQTKLVVRALTNDDFLAISDLRPAGAGGIAQRCNSYCQPVGEPIALHADWLGAAANSSGEIALAFVFNPADWFLRLYEPDGTPVGDQWTAVLEPAARPLTLTWPKPLAFDDNGTIWVAWYQNGGFSRPVITMLRPFVPGDMNRDGLVNNFDIDPFVFALSNLPGYAAAYNIPEDAAVIIGDINEDGVLNNFDIDPFVMLLAGE